MRKVKILNNLNDLTNNSVYLLSLSITNDNLIIFKESDDNAVSFLVVLDQLNKFNAEYIFKLSNINELESLMPLVSNLENAKFNYSFLSNNLSVLKYLSILTNKKCFYINNEPTERHLYDIRLNDLGLATKNDIEKLHNYKNNKISLFIMENEVLSKSKNVIYYGDIQ